MNGNIESTVKNNKKIIYYVLIFFIWAIYVYVTFTTPIVSSDQFRITEAQVFVLRTSISAMYLFMWMGGLYGVLSMQSQKLKGFGVVGNGLFLILLAFIIPTVVNAIGAPYIQVEKFNMIMTIVNNYFYVLLPLIGFYLIFKGLKAVWSLADEVVRTLDDKIITGFFVLLISGVYTYFVFTNNTRQMSDIPGIKPTYYLPDLLIFLTIIVPSVVAWGFGVYSALLAGRIANLSLVTEEIRLTRLVKGIWFVIFSSILLQMLLSLGTSRLLSLGVGTILVIVYLFLLLQLLGFLLVAFSIKRKTIQL